MRSKRSSSSTGGGQRTDPGLMPSIRKKDCKHLPARFISNRRGGGRGENPFWGCATHYISQIVKGKLEKQTHTHTSVKCEQHSDAPVCVSIPQHQLTQAEGPAGSRKSKIIRSACPSPTTTEEVVSVLHLSWGCWAGGARG